MNYVCGMSLADFNSVISEMKTIYPFKDDEAYLGNLRDIISDSMRRVEIMTKDKNTGIEIVLSKEVDPHV